MVFQQNLTQCGPTGTWGGYEQTLFLGCSIMSFTASVGWNEQVTELSIQLVRDDCESPSGTSKLYYDSGLAPRTMTAADPGFIGDGDNGNNAIIGCPAYFRIADFEFAGLIQSWEKSHSDTSHPVYTVKMTDPREILAGSQLIIGEYAGSVSPMINLINVFGYMETYGIPCTALYFDGVSAYTATPDSTDGIIFGAESNYFGGAQTNENGIQWNRMRDAMDILINAIPRQSNAFSPYGRILFKGPLITDTVNSIDAATIRSTGMGLMPQDTGIGASGFCEYYVDTSEVPVAPTYWRFPGSNISILEAVTQVTQDAGFEYYIELIPVTGTDLSPSDVAKFIKIRTVDRGTQPTFGHIQTFIDQQDASGFISSSVGRELRNEPVAAFVIGGPKQVIYQATGHINPEVAPFPGDTDGVIGGFDGTTGLEVTVAGDTNDASTGGDQIDDVILPYFGLDSSNNVIVPMKDTDGKWQFVASIVNLKTNLKSNAFIAGGGAFGGITSVLITEHEMQHALGGYDSWLSWTTSAQEEDPGATNKTIGKLMSDAGLGQKGIFNISHLLGALKILGANFFKPADLHRLKGVFDIDNVDNKKAVEDLQIIYQFVQEYAQDFYGKKYMVRSPFTCAKSDDESGKIVLSEVPTDGGWTDYTNLGGLSHPGSTSIFTQGDGRLGAFVNMGSNGDWELSHLDPSDFLVDGGTLYVKAEVDTSLVFHDKATFFGPRVVVTLPQAITEIEDSAEYPKGYRGVALLYEILGGLAAGVARDKILAILEHAGRKLAHVSKQYQALFPEWAAIPFKSNINTYGPWVYFGPAGRVAVIHDNGLVPWEYGGRPTMNLAGQSKADEAVTLMQVGEFGTVNVPGYPTLPLGAELGAVAGGFFGGGLNLIENRAHTTGTVDETQIISNVSTPVSITYGYFTYGSTWTGLYGPQITGISVSVGPQGVTTQYTMKTFTPRYARFSKSNAARLKRVGAERLQAQKDIRDFQTKRNPFIRQQIQFRQREDRRARGSEGFAIHSSTPHDMLVGDLLNWGSGDITSPPPTTGDLRRANVVGLGSTELGTEVSPPAAYQRKGMMSMDGLLRPISMDGDGSLPQYAQRITGCFNDRITTAYAHPPMFENNNGATGDQIYALPIDIDYLHPFNNPTGYNRSAVATDRSDTPDIGHDIEALARGTGIPTSIQMAIEGISDKKRQADYYDDYRGMAFKGPFLIQMWGYDTDGMPIPNKADNVNDASGGNFVSEGLECKFLDYHLRKSYTWPVAPLDLRYDRKRALWVSPPRTHLVQGEVLGEIPAYGSGLIKVTGIHSGDLYDCDGNQMYRPLFWAYERVGCTHTSGNVILADYDPGLCQYHIIHHCASGTGVAAGGGGGGSITVSNETGCVGVNSPASSFTTTAFNFKKGLFAIENGASTVDVGLSMNVNAQTGIAGINFTSCFDISATGDCQALIGIKQSLGAATGIELVSAVICSGSAIVYCTNILNFNECGMLTGVTE